MECKNKIHRVCDLTSPTNVLLASHADVDQDPENETRTQFIEGFNIETPNGGVQFTTDEELD